MPLLDGSETDSLAQTCNEKERAFCREYVIDFNGTKAIHRAGCFNCSTDEAAAVSACRILTRANVQAYLAILKAQRELRVNMTADSVLQEMALLSHSDQSHYSIGTNGEILLTPGAPEGAMRAIQSVKRRKTIKEDKAGNVTITHDVEIKLWDKPAPLKLMGRHVGLFPDKVEVTGKDGAPLEMITKIERVIVKAGSSE
jgi:phage terminase small subunit